MASEFTQEELDKIKGDREFTPKYPGVTVRLVNENGNVFNLIGITILTMKRSGLNQETIDEFQSNVLSLGSYEEVLLKIMEWVTVK